MSFDLPQFEFHLAEIGGDPLASHLKLPAGINA